MHVYMYMTFYKILLQQRNKRANKREREIKVKPCDKKFSFIYFCFHEKEHDYTYVYYIFLKEYQLLVHYNRKITSKSGL